MMQNFKKYNAVQQDDDIVCSRPSQRLAVYYFSTWTLNKFKSKKIKSFSDNINIKKRQIMFFSLFYKTIHKKRLIVYRKSL